MSKKNIDRLFQENLKGFEAVPDDMVWDKISSSLGNTTKNKKGVFWYWGGSVAAIFIVGFLLFDFYYNNELDVELELVEKSMIEKDSIVSKSSKGVGTNLKNKVSADNKKINSNRAMDTSKQEVIKKFKEVKEVVASNHKTIKKSVDKVIQVSKEEIIKDIKGVEEVVVINDKLIGENKKGIDKVIQISKQEITKNLKEIVVVNNKPIEQNKIVNVTEVEGEILLNVIDENVISQPIALKDNSNKKNLNEVINDKKSIDVSIKNNWVFAPVFSQLFTNSMSSKSTINSELDLAQKEGINSNSFGLKIAFQASDKWTFQSGLNEVSLGQRTIENNSLINFSEDIVNDSVDSNQNLSENIIDNENIEQTYSYIEIPLEAKYKFYNTQKIGIHFIGGMSALILTNSTVNTEQSNIDITNTIDNRVNNFNYSLNLGTDLEYVLSKKWFLNVGPMFKIQLNTFEKINNTPYYLGIHSGINYKF